jgi:hypothetical protein
MREQTRHMKILAAAAQLLRPITRHPKLPAGVESQNAIWYASGVIRRDLVRYQGLPLPIRGGVASFSGLAVRPPFLTSGFDAAIQFLCQ